MQDEYSVLRFVRARVVSRGQELIAASRTRCLSVSVEDRRWLATSVERVESLHSEWLEWESRVLAGAAGKGEVQAYKQRVYLELDRISKAPQWTHYLAALRQSLDSEASQECDDRSDAPATTPRST